jgi:STE24 endopeptidase
MMAAMSDWNFMSVIILVGLFVLWKLELAATLLNIKAFPNSVPKPLEGLMDTEKLEQARRYLGANARFGILQSTVSLAVLLAFWTFGGFGWLDGLSRSLTASPVGAGLIFLSLPS